MRLINKQRAPNIKGNRWTGSNRKIADTVYASGDFGTLRKFHFNQVLAGCAGGGEDYCCASIIILMRVIVRKIVTSNFNNI